AVARSLSAHGINTAADFTGIYNEIGPRGGKELYIRRRYGTPVHPTGVGEKKARDLDNWRKSVEARALDTQPSSLPWAQARAIRATYLQERQALADQEKVARDQYTQDQKQVNLKWVQQHAAISGRITTTRQTFAQERLAAHDDLTSSKKQADQTVLQRELAK